MQFNSTVCVVLVWIAPLWQSSERRNFEEGRLSSLTSWLWRWMMFVAVSLVVLFKPCNKRLACTRCQLLVCSACRKIAAVTFILPTSTIMPMDASTPLLN